jgi:pimeloyl-ACP methyl ester carboxylesterase
MHAPSADHVNIAYETTGTGDTALVFVHGWLGNKRWWDTQRDAFAATHTVVQLDLAGHGDSGGNRSTWSVQAYAADIQAVAAQLTASRIVLVGHSMSGAHVVEASLGIDRTAAIILVDTLKDLDQVTPPAQIEQMLGLYRNDYRATVENILPQFLFSPQTSAAVRAQLTAEFLHAEGSRAAQLLEPLYRYDPRLAAPRITVPVHAINGDLHPTNLAVSRTYFRDFDAAIIPGVGHYPMLERPADFNAHLRIILDALHL